MRSGLTLRNARSLHPVWRVMSTWDGFVYNFLTMGVIFPWIYVWGAANFPAAELGIAIGLTFLVQLPISLSYCFLSAVLPVSGGDYIYQTRAFGKIGFVVVMSGFVLWILQWVALSGWLFATLGLSPLLLSLGVETHNANLSRLGVMIEGSTGVFCISILLACFTTIFLIRGLRLYVKVQNILFAFTLGAIIAVIYVLHSHQQTFATNLNEFVRVLVQQVGIPRAFYDRGRFPDGLVSSFVVGVKNDVAAHGYSSVSHFPLRTIVVHTLGVVPIAWTSLQWAAYSVQQNSEISGADKFWRQAFMLVCSASLVAILLILMGHYEAKTATSEFVRAASVAYWSDKASEPTKYILNSLIQPLPNVLAMAVEAGWKLKLIIALGFLANAFQITCNCFIGMTRILIAMGRDGMLPNRLFPEWTSSDAKRRVHWAYFLASLPVIAASSFIHSWRSTSAVAVTLACGYVFVFTSLSATRIPSSRLRNFWMCSDIYQVPARVIITFGYLGAALGSFMLLAYLFMPDIDASGPTLYMLVALVLAASYFAYAYARSRSSSVEIAFEQVFPELEGLDIDTRE